MRQYQEFKTRESEDKSKENKQNFRYFNRDKFHHTASHEDPNGEERDIALLHFNFGARWGGWSTPGSSRFTSG
jgi:hypothetical protein